MDALVLTGIWGAVESDDADRVRGVLTEQPEELTDWPGFASSWLHYAAAEGKTRAIGVFLEAGLDVNWGRRDPGDTPLVCALNRGQYDAAKYLLSRGANPSLGRALIAALNSETNSFEMVKLLVENGVDVNQAWRFGDEDHGPLFNALSWAIDCERPDIAEYLRAHGAVMPPTEEKPSYATAADEIVAYFQRRFGTADKKSLGEIVPTSGRRVLIHRIGPTEDRDSVILFTTGMSDEPMTVPDGADEFRYAELMIELPKGWPLSGKALKEEDNRWPIDWLRRIPAYVRSEKTWLGGEVAIMANSDPPSPFAPGCRFTSMLIVMGYDDVGPVVMADGRNVQIYTLVPLYEDERQLEISQDLPELFRRLDQFDVGRRVNLSRPSVASFSQGLPAGSNRGDGP